MPNSPVLLVSLSVLHLETGQLYQALDAAQKAMQLDPRLPMVHGQLGAVLLKLGRCEECSNRCRKRCGCRRRIDKRSSIWDWRALVCSDGKKRRTTCAAVADGPIE